MAIISTPPTSNALRYAHGVNGKASGRGVPAPEPEVEEPESHSIDIAGTADASAAESVELPVIELRPVPEAEDTVGDHDSRSYIARPLSALVKKANQHADVIGALRRAREQLPGDPSFGDPLSVSGPGGARAVARAADRLVGGTPSAAREIGFGTLQVWQAFLERLGRGKGEQEVTVMFTDLVAFSGWSLTAGDETTLALLRRVAGAIEPPIGAHGGHLVKRMGDGVMAVFGSADDAVHAAVAAKRNLADVCVDGYRPRMRVGLHTGSPREIGGDWLGVDVTIAARVMEAGGNGRTMISEATLDSLSPETLADLGYTVRPSRRSFFSAPLNGVPEDLRIYRLTAGRP